jgi:hypothetical protein
MSCCEVRSWLKTGELLNKESKSDSWRSISSSSRSTNLRINLRSSSFRVICQPSGLSFLSVCVDFSSS